MTDFIRRLCFIYAARLPQAVSRRDWTIGFRYAPPIGSFKLLLRANYGADAFIHSEVFEHDHYRLPLPHPPETILDLGANIGLATAYLARLFPGARLACVEPFPDNVRVLAENLRINRIAAEVIAAAVGVADGKLAMQASANDYGHRVADGALLTPEMQFEVEAISIPSIMRRLGWSRIGLLKIDIEGYEKPLLSQQCDWLELVDAICLEYHFEGAAEHLSRLAGRFGFRPPRQLTSGIWLIVR
jgi:FkbM family methyltransferase